MKKAVYSLLAVAMIYSCGAKEEKKEDKKEEAKEETAKDTLMGVEFDATKAITPAEFMTAFQGKDSMEVTIKGTVAEVCKKKGCWMTMDMGDGKTMRVSYNYKFLLPLNCDGLPIVINGKAFVDTVSVEMLKEYAEDEGATKEEVDAITEPEVNLSFLATGVILSNE